MEKDRRDHLRGVIGTARTDIEGSLVSALAAYGLRVDSEAIPLAQLSLDDAQRALYPRLVDVVSREARAVGVSDPLAPQAVRRYVREAGGTWINRLAALRALEARGMLSPWAAFVSDEYASTSPRALRLQERDPSLGAADALRGGIVEACAELSTAVRVLFDTDDDKTLMWPSHAVLRRILRAFSDDVTDDDWQQDDVLGWVYQYYNTEANAELKRRKNKTKSYRYTADDIPIANQFYTPHWVVRVLTDNTLGRLWLESKGRDPRMTAAEETVGGATRTRWSLLERRRDVPDASKDLKAYRAWIAVEPDPVRDLTVDGVCRYMVPLPSTPPERAPRRAQDLKVIDPACGSGHFLLYAFEVLVAIWRESEPALDPLEIPALILEHNLYGLDIDLRAAQLAAFNLYLKARVTHRALAKAAGRPDAPFAVRRVNIVVADAHLGDDPRKQTFLDRYKTQPDVQALYAQVLQSVDDTNVLGGLLKVRSTFEALFRKASDAEAVEKAIARKALAPRQATFSFGGSGQRELAEVFVAGSGKHWTLMEMLDELRAFEREALAQQDVGARLFYSDLGRTLGLLGLLSQQYDVVLMNPPYGEDMPEAAKDYCKGNRKRGIKAHYPRTKDDYAVAFVEQGLDLLHLNGYIGALVPRSGLYLPSFDIFREQELVSSVAVREVVDLGRGILDRADVRVSCWILQRSRAEQEASVCFARLSYYRDANRHHYWTERLPQYCADGPSDSIEWYCPDLKSLLATPGTSFIGYWLPASIRSLFVKFPPLDSENARRLVGRPDETIGYVRAGLSTGEDACFVRYWWEVKGDHWWKYDKGGAAISYLYVSNHVLNWSEDGEVLKRHPVTAIRNEKFFLLPHIAYASTTWRLVRYGVSDAPLFSAKANSIFLSDGSLLALVALLNSGLGGAMMLAQSPDRDWLVSMVASIPVPRSVTTSPELVEGAQRVLGGRQRCLASDETCRDFTIPDLLRQHRDSPTTPFALEEVLVRWLADRQHFDADTASLLRELDDEVYRLYGISTEDRALIERELARRPKAEGGYRDDGPEESGADEKNDNDETDDEETADHAPTTLTPAVSRDLVARWVSYYVKRCIEADDDGIVPVASSNREDALILRMRVAMRSDLGAETAGLFELQAARYLGTASVAEWLEVSGEDTLPDAAGKKKKEPRGFLPWHVRLYRNRPIFWMLSSEGFEKGLTRSTFRVYLHALKVSGDTLTKVREYYLRPELDRVKRELELAHLRRETAQGTMKATAEREHQEWVNTDAALKAFMEAVDAVAKGPPKREVVAVSAKWLPRTIAAVRGGQDVGHGWRPDVDHGVKVNITPLVEARLLPRVVLKKLGGK